MALYSPRRDWLWLASVALYALNRWVLKAHFDAPFLHGQLTDLLAIPIWAPVQVAILHRVGLRGADAPRAWEVLALVLVFSLAFEVLLPGTTMFGPFGRGDAFDVLAYAAGGVVGQLWWNCGFWRKMEAKISHNQRGTRHN